MSFFSELYDNGTRPPDGQRMFSVTTGKVVENWNEKHPGMVQVEIFLGENGKNRTDWVRVAQPYAGKEYRRTRCRKWPFTSSLLHISYI